MMSVQSVPFLMTELIHKKSKKSACIFEKYVI